MKNRLKGFAEVSTTVMSKHAHQPALYLLTLMIHKVKKHTVQTSRQFGLKQPLANDTLRIIN